MKRLPTTPSEAETLKLIQDYLEVLQNQGRVLFVRHNPVRVIHVGSTIRIVKGRESQKGAPDLFVWVEGGVSAAIETKAKKGILSDEQEGWRCKAARIGLAYLICRSFDDFREQTGL